MKNNYFWKFNRYAFEILLLTVVGFLATLYLTLNLTYIFICNNIFVIYGIYKFAISIKNYPYRLKIYLILQKCFKTRIKKSIIYELLDDPCSSCIAKELVKEFYIELN